MKRKLRWLAPLIALCCTLVCMPQLSVVADVKYEWEYVKGTTNNHIIGDVNCDGVFDEADVRLLQGWLLRTETMTTAQLEYADLDQNLYVNAVDLALLKQLLLDAASSADSFEMFLEAEDATISGSNQIISDSSASGAKVVGTFADDADTLSFAVSIPTGGSYRFTLTSMGLGGNKLNNLLVDGVNVGTFSSQGDSYSDSVVRRVMLTAGQHTLTITKSWGWIRIDCLKITEDENISDSVYDVNNTLINPKANADAKKLFTYLCDSYGKVTLSGQVCNDAMNGDEFKAIYEVTGKYPAIVGLDMMDYCPSRTALGARSNAVDTAIAFDQQGGIATFCWHWNAPTKYLKDGTSENGSPRWWAGYSTSNTTFDIAAVMDGRDPEGKTLIDADIAEIAKQLKRLENAGVPVLWRPLHEASGGWFWWGAKGAKAYKKLWCYLYEQLTNTYGCNNLIWVWNGQAADWYPGDAFVDIIGEDIYAGERVYGAQNAKFSELLEYADSNKIIALTENGTVFDINQVIAANSKWAWFGTWCGDFIVSNGSFTDRYTEAAVLKKTYQSEYVITLDELPEF